MNFLRSAGLVACMAFASIGVQAQSLHFKLEPPVYATASVDSFSRKSGSMIVRPTYPSLVATKSIFPAGAATAHYGFFCKQELKWDKKLPTQLRFRVGSYEACDRLEGKRRD